MLQHDSLTRFEENACNIQALKDHVVIRHAWVENLAWNWPDGERAEWNTRYCSNGASRKVVSLYVALNDVS